MLNPGKYRAVAASWGFGFTQEGRPQIEVVFDLVDHPGEQISWYGYFTEKTQDRTLESLRHCGWTCDRIEDLQGMGTQEVSLVVEHDTYRGKTTAKVQWVNRGGGVGLKQQMDASQLADFARQMRGAAVASRQNYKGGSSAPDPQRQAPAQRQNTYEPPPHTDSDIPPF